MKFGVQYEQVIPRKVFERDSWRCGICHRKVDKRLSYPHPRSASIDHILPMKHGGSHTYLNVQYAHLRCNSSKGHRGSGEQLALIG